MPFLPFRYYVFFLQNNLALMYRNVDGDLRSINPRPVDEWKTFAKNSVRIFFISDFWRRVDGSISAANDQSCSVEEESNRTFQILWQIRQVLADFRAAGRIEIDHFNRSKFMGWWTTSGNQKFGKFLEKIGKNQVSKQKVNIWTKNIRFCTTSSCNIGQWSRNCYNWQQQLTLVHGSPV